jgi:hypothetical protein
MWRMGVSHAIPARGAPYSSKILPWFKYRRCSVKSPGPREASDSAFGRSALRLNLSVANPVHTANLDQLESASSRRVCF